jgi:hypothetical protein
MAMKEQQRSTHRSMQGKEIDMHKLVMQNEMTVAVGNAKVNARGDELGAGGKIIRKQEDVLRESPIKVPEQFNVRNNTAEPVRKNVEDMDPEGNE